jgi:serine/threonine protein kinase
LYLALKVPIDRSSKTPAEFNREKRMLLTLRHDHIVRLLQTFSVPTSAGEREYCSLFPLATCTLRRYIRSRYYKLGQDFVVWILKQMHGLASGLRSVHVYEDENGLTFTGYNHDLKPANILYFQHSGEPFGILRIANWGLGRFHSKKSGSGTRTVEKCDPTYASPEALLEKKASRPADIWSMGCTDLDFLVWIILGPEEVRTFEAAR